MITLIVVTDGRRDCLTRTVSSLTRLRGPISGKLIHDDSGDPDYHAWLERRFTPMGFRVTDAHPRLGYTGAYRYWWRWVRDHDRNPWIWLQEDDFVLTRDVDLRAVIDVMTRHPVLTQMALLRQPVNPAERAAGGIIEMHPDDYQTRDGDGHTWVEHRRHFTTNPCLIPRWLVCDRDWPNVRHSEGHFGIDLFTNPSLRAAYWGDGSRWCEHIGDTRVGTGY